ncbi:MAG: SpoIIE family protein phosphatase [Verrucomicrobiota bacterium]|nr:SpoIIE family protein phosphatase [Verrucomicrobiota bacterium]
MTKKAFWSKSFLEGRIATRGSQQGNMEKESSIKILAVDDDSFMRKIVKVCLPEPTYQVTACANAMEAMALFKEEHFDLLILDIMMPGISGMELRSLIRNENPDIPIIMLTAKVDDADGTLLKEISSDKNTYYQSKGFSREQLEGTVASIVSELQATKEEKTYFAEMEKDISLAGEIQKFMLPHWYSHENGASFAHYYFPYMQITGDIVNTFKISDGLFLKVVGDISGHGIRSALCMSAVEISIANFIRKASSETIEPHHLLNHLQAFLEEISTDHYMTCLVGIIDFNKNRIAYQTAGHPEFVIYSPSQGLIEQPDIKEKGSIPLGLVPEAVYTPDDTHTISFPEDSIIFAYTDGLNDIQNKHGQTSSDELLQEFITSVAKEGLTPSTTFRIADVFFKLGYNVVKDDISISAISKTTTKPCTHSYSVPPSIKAIDDFVQVAHEVVFAHTKNKALSAKVEITLSEFLNNVFIHSLGNRSAMRPIIFISIELREKDVLLSVYDRGKAWDLQPASLVDDHEAEQQNRNLEFSGRGLYLLKKLTSSICRNRYADALNETTFTIDYK